MPRVCRYEAGPPCGRCHWGLGRNPLRGRGPCKGRAVMERGRPWGFRSRSLIGGHEEVTGWGKRMRT
eukprot:3691371-Pyramimonas_sp.AAC.1